MSHLMNLSNMFHKFLKISNLLIIQSVTVFRLHPPTRFLPSANCSNEPSGECSRQVVWPLCNPESWPSADLHPPSHKTCFPRERPEPFFPFLSLRLAYLLIQFLTFRFVSLLKDSSSSRAWTDLPLLSRRVCFEKLIIYHLPLCISRFPVMSHRSRWASHLDNVAHWQQTLLATLSSRNNGFWNVKKSKLKREEKLKPVISSFRLFHDLFRFFLGPRFPSSSSFLLTAKCSTENGSSGPILGFIGER